MFICCVDRLAIIKIHNIKVFGEKTMSLMRCLFAGSHTPSLHHLLVVANATKARLAANASLLCTKHLQNPHGPSANQVNIVTFKRKPKT